MITSSHMGAFRFIGCHFSVKDMPFESELLKIDSVIREHPYFQKMSNRAILILRHHQSAAGLMSGDSLVGREVIGPPLAGEELAGLKIYDANPTKSLSRTVHIKDIDSAEKLFTQYQEVMAQAQPAEVGEYWKLEYNLGSADAAALHIPLENQKLFPQFVDN